jgi:hypothetical protein
MNAQYCARTGRDYCCVVLKRNEKEKKKNTKKNVDSSYNMCGRRNSGLFWTIFEDLRRDEGRFFFNYFRMCAAC